MAREAIESAPYCEHAQNCCPCSFLRVFFGKTSYLWGSPGRRHHASAMREGRELLMTDGGWGLLMAAAQRGEPAPYRELLDQLRPWLMRYYRRRLPPSMIEDAVQDTMISVHEKRHTFDPTRQFEPWLAAIARYKWIDRLRVLKRATFEELDENSLMVEDHHSAVVSATILEALLAELKPAQREVIRLVKIQGLSIEEAAAKSGQSAALVKVNIHRGLAKMAAHARKVEQPEPLAV